ADFAILLPSTRDEAGDRIAGPLLRVEPGGAMMIWIPRITPARGPGDALDTNSDALRPMRPGPGADPRRGAGGDCPADGRRAGRGPVRDGLRRRHGLPVRAVPV